MNLKITKIILITLFIILAIVESIWLFAVPRYINSAITSHKFEQILKEKSGLIVTFESLKIETKFDFSIKSVCRNFLLRDSNGNKILTIGQSESSVSLPPLLFKKIKAKKIEYKDVFFEFSRNKDGKFYIGNSVLGSEKDFDFHNLHLLNLKAQNVNLVFNDKLLNKKIKTEVKSAGISYKNNDYLDFYLNADSFINDKHKSLIDLSYSSSLHDVKGTIKNFDLSDYSPYIAHFSKKDVLSVSGILNADFEKNSGFGFYASLKDFAVKMKNPLDSIKADSEIIFDIDTNYDDKKINIINSKIFGKNWKIEIDGIIKDYKNKNAKPDLNVNIPKSDIHSLYHIIPSIDGDPNDSIQKFKKYGAWGNIEGKLQIKGTSNAPEVYGNIHLSDVYIVKFNPAVPKCKIDVTFIKDKVKVVTRVFTGKNQYVDVNGIADMEVNGAGDFHVSSSPAVDLETVQYILVPIHEVVGFELGPVPYMKLAGVGNIDIYTKGTVVDGEVSGYFNFYNTTASLNGLNTVLKNTDGHMDFQRKKMHFFTKRALIKGQPLKIDGKADLDGNIDFDVTSSAIDMADLLEILNKSPMLADKKAMVEPIEKLSGNVITSIKIKGLVKDFNELFSDDDLGISGHLILKNSKGKLKLSPLSAQNLNGTVDFDEDDWKINLTGNLGSSKFTASGESKNGRVRLNTSANELKTDELINIVSLAEKNKYPKLPQTNSLINFKAEYNSDSQNFDMKKINASGFFKPLPAKTNFPFVISSGSFKLENGDLTFKNFNAKFFNSKIYVDGKIKDLFSQKPVSSYDADISTFDIASFNTLKKMNFLPSYVNKVINAYENYKGIANITISCRNNKPKGLIELKDVSFDHAYFKTPVVVDSGNIIIDGQRLTMKSVIARVDNTPLFVNASVWDLDKELKFSGYFTTKLTDSFANKYINSLLTYPVKPKGDITVTSDISGSLTDYQIHSKIRFAQDADIYYMGANLGDEDNIREIIANVNILNNTYYVRRIDYLRYMTSQNDKVYPITVLTSRGVIQRESAKKFYIRNLNLETVNSANVKMFNVIFKKSVLKNGMFNCKLNIRGDMDNPHITGNVYMDNLDMPLYDTIVKNIGLKFTDKVIDVKANGVTYNSDFTLTSTFLNKFKPPYIIENLNIDSKKINLDTMIDSLTQIPTPGVAVKMAESAKAPLNISDFQIKNGTMSAEDILIRGLPAKNYRADFNLGNDLVLRLDKLGFDVTTGNVVGTATYDFSSGKIRADLSADDVDSNKIASSWFDFKDQIFGQANGRIVFTTVGNSENERIKNLAGNVYFEIEDGKMPKLGSVEYLLKAGNLIKSGITGASISNFLDLIAPIKTGYFDSIKGKMVLKNGVAQDVEIFSKGDNLNIYINGEYDVLQEYANLRVYGRLTKKATNILGAVGNLSFNSILNAIPGFKLDKEDKLRIIKDLNKIPGVELSDQQYRVFTAKIDGKINEEKYVKSFRWIE